MEAFGTTASQAPAGPVEALRCMLCDRGARRGDLLRAEQVRRQVAEYLAHKFPNHWRTDGWACRACLTRERSHYVVDRLEQERGALSSVEAEVARRAGEHVTSGWSVQCDQALLVEGEWRMR